MTPRGEGTRVTVGSNWRDKDQRPAGRVVTVCRIDGQYAIVRNEAPSHRRSRILLSRLVRDYEWVGQIIMDTPQYWPAYFAEDVTP